MFKDFTCLIYIQLLATWVSHCSESGGVDGFSTGVSNCSGNKINYDNSDIYSDKQSFTSSNFTRSSVTGSGIMYFDNIGSSAVISTSTFHRITGGLYGLSSTPSITIDRINKLHNTKTASKPQIYKLERIKATIKDNILIGNTQVYMISRLIFQS